MGLGGESTNRIIKESLTGVIFEPTSEKDKGGNSKNMVRKQERQMGGREVKR